MTMDEKKLSAWEAFAPELVAEVRRLQKFFLGDITMFAKRLARRLERERLAEALERGPTISSREAAETIRALPDQWCLNECHAPVDTGMAMSELTLAQENADLKRQLVAMDAALSEAVNEAELRGQDTGLALAQGSANAEVRRLQAVVAELKAEFGTITRNASRAERTRCAQYVQERLDEWIKLFHDSPVPLGDALSEEILALPDAP